MATAPTTISVAFKVQKNKKYGDHRVVEFFDGKWNNERDNNWTKPQADLIKEQLSTELMRANSAMIVPVSCDTALYIDDKTII